MLSTYTDNQLLPLARKVVVVTGGAGALGREFCAAIAASGATVIVADRDRDAACEIASNIVASGGNADPCALDITDIHSIREMIALVSNSHGHVSAVVNNAYPRNANYGRRLEDVEFADFCDNVGMHLGGYFLVSQQFAAYFRTLGSGTIVNISSIYGVIAPRFDLYEGTPMGMPVEYAAIKAGVLHLTRYFAKYLAGTGVRVNAISPGGILASQPEAFLRRYDAMCSSKGMLDPHDITGTLIFLLSENSRYINGQNIIVDDGFTL